MIRSILLLVLAVSALPAETIEKTIHVGGMERRYDLHVPGSISKDRPASTSDLDSGGEARPTGRPAPLVFVFHGGGGDIDKAKKLGFSPLADREGFLVAYPLAYEKNWNDGRDGKMIRSQQEKIDDIGFVAAMIDQIGREYAVDPSRIYATGASNGGFMSNRVGAELSSRIAAIAPVIGGMAPAIAESLQPGQPVSVLIMQGTEDPLVPFEGGHVTVFRKEQGGRGKNIDTRETVRKWIEYNGCQPDPVVTELPDADPGDKTRVIVETYTGGKKGAEVLLYTIRGGGHTWPGGRQYLPERFIGRVSKDIDATQVIWEFFKAHPKR